MRLEKPHSLSYQLSTRTSLPSMTAVSRLSTVELAGQWLKSMETSGSSVSASTPFSGPESDAAFRRLLISSTLVSPSGVTGRSTLDTWGLGTLLAAPPHCPPHSRRPPPTA